MEWNRSGIVTEKEMEMEWILTTKEVDNGMEMECKWNGEIMPTSDINIWFWKWNGMEMEMQMELPIISMEFPYEKIMSFMQFH